MSTKFNPEEYYVIRADYSSEKTPMLDWGNTSSLKFLYAEEIQGLETPLEVMYYATAPKNPQWNDILKLGSFFAVSDKLMQVLETFKLVKTQYFPINIVDKKKAAVTGYNVIHCYNAIAALDRNTYEGDPIEDDEICQLERFAFETAVLNTIPLQERLVFRFAENMQYLFVHQQVVDVIKQEDFTGVMFYPVNNWLPKK